MGLAQYVRLNPYRIVLIQELKPDDPTMLHKNLGFGQSSSQMKLIFGLVVTPTSKIAVIGATTTLKCSKRYRCTHKDCECGKILAWVYGIKTVHSITSGKRNLA